MTGTRNLGQARSQTGRRGASRLRLQQPAELITLDGQIRCCLINLSQTGARVEVSRPPRPGAAGYLRFCGEEIFGTIVWSKGDACGMQFDDPVPPKVMIAARDFADANPHLVREQFNGAVRDWVSGRGRLV